MAEAEALEAAVALLKAAPVGSVFNITVVGGSFTILSAGGAGSTAVMESARSGVRAQGAKNAKTLLKQAGQAQTTKIASIFAAVAARPVVFAQRLPLDEYCAVHADDSQRRQGRSGRRWAWTGRLSCRAFPSRNVRRTLRFMIINYKIIDIASVKSRGTRTDNCDAVHCSFLEIRATLSASYFLAVANQQASTWPYYATPRGARGVA